MIYPKRHLGKILFRFHLWLFSLPLESSWTGAPYYRDHITRSTLHLDGQSSSLAAVYRGAKWLVIRVSDAFYILPYTKMVQNLILVLLGALSIDLTTWEESFIQSYDFVLVFLY